MHEYHSIEFVVEAVEESTKHVVTDVYLFFIVSILLMLCKICDNTLLKY